MLRSMTAFGRARGVSRSGNRDITVEVKSVNSRYLDLSIRLPRSLSHLEDKIRTYISERGIVRGKVELSVTADVISQDGGDIILDEGAAEAYIRALCALRDRFSLADDISVMTVAQNHELFRTRRPADDCERDYLDVLPIMSEALDVFCRRREDEGAALVRDIHLKMDRIRALAERAKALSEADIADYRERLYTRIKKVLDESGMEVAESRIITEAALYADRVAVDEETVRLESHFAAMDEMLASDQPSGRKLDFLIQEMNREVNTMGSKSNVTELSLIVVEMKNELEKTRVRFINIGFSNMVSADRIVAVATPDSAPIKRLIQDSRDFGRVIDCSCGRKTRSVIVTDSDHVILSAIQAETIAGRLDGECADDFTDDAELDE